MRKGVGLVGAVCLTACGGVMDSGLFDGGSGNDAGGGEGSVVSDGATDSTVVDTGPPCTGLECQIVKCSTGTTTLSGTVMTPNGKYPVYNAAVYIPNQATAAIADGVTCQACQAPLSGKPLVTGQLAIATTDSKGQFTLKDVPVGPNIPLVVQIGKWRREASVTVTQCTDNPVNPDAIRLPKNQQEGHLPLIAVQAGQCDDPVCTLLTRIGIDQAELTPASGTGRVHTYVGSGGGVAVPPGSGDAYALWGNLTTMMKYDLLINGCECSPFARDTQGPAYDNLHKYLEAGGRFIGTHYHYNWFANAAQFSNDATCKGPTDFNGVAQWGMTTAQPPTSVDTGHPRGAAFASWLVDQSAATTLGTADLVAQDLRYDVGPVTAGTTRWMSESSGAESLYLTFNTPIGSTSQCGRAAFSDMHVRSDNPTTWPSSCQAPPATGPNNELAFTFLFFDMFGCVQDDTKAPVVPPSQ